MEVGQVGRQLMKRWRLDDWRKWRTLVKWTRKSSGSGSCGRCSLLGSYFSGTFLAATERQEQRGPATRSSLLVTS